MVTGILEFDAEVSKGLCKLLTLFPRELEVAHHVVFTTRADIWLGFLHENGVIIDLSTICGHRKKLPDKTLGNSETSIQAHVIDELLRAGWPPASVRYNVRLTSQHTGDFLVDIMLMTSKEEALAIFEVKQTYHWTRNSAFEQVLNAVQLAKTASGKPIVWACITDGYGFHVQNIITGEIRILDHVPTPSELGMSFDSNTTRIVIPGSAQELHAVLADVQPDAVSVDFTLPFASGSTISSDVAYTLFPTNLPSPKNLELRDAVIAWAIDYPITATLSAVVPASFVASHSHRDMRKAMAERINPWAVLDLPSDMFAPVTGISSTLLCLGGDRDLAYFDTVATRNELKRIEAQPWYKSLVAWARSEKTTTGYLTHLDTSRPFSYRAQHPDLLADYQRLSQLGRDTIQLQDVCLVIAGARLPSKLHASDIDDSVYVVRSKNIGGNGVIEFDENSKVPKTQVPEDTLLQPGDLVFQAALVPHPTPIALYQDSFQAVAGSDLVIIRVVNNSLGITPLYLREYLSSPAMRRLIEATATGSGVPRARISALARLPIPLVSAQLMADFDRLHDAQKKLEARAHQLQSMRRSLFDSTNASEFSTAFRKLQLEGVVTTAILGLSERLDFQIRNLFPFPLAFGYRSLGGIPEPAPLYQEQLRFAENLLAYMGSVALALLVRDERRHSDINLQYYWSRGISPGHWREIVLRAIQNHRTWREHSLSQSLQRLEISRQQTGFGKAIDRLIQAKNDFKHDRGPDLSNRADVESASLQVRDALDYCMEALHFFTEFPLRMLVSSEVARSGGFHVVTLRYVGDHPAHSKEILRTPRVPFPNNEVFIDLGEDDWLSLYPFITVAHCPSCRSREIYFIDKWDTHRGTADLKSFERGHEEHSADIATALSNWNNSDD